jgi:hypothetical protein
MSTIIFTKRKYFFEGRWLPCGRRRNGGLHVALELLHGRVHGGVALLCLHRSQVFHAPGLHTLVYL